MAICPIANSVGCNKCGMVNFCFLKTVLGNYGEDSKDGGDRNASGTAFEEQPGQQSEDDSMDEGGRVVSGTTTEAKTTESESKPPD